MTAHGVDSTEAARSALEQQMESGQKYNVVLLDMWLNGSDASELVYFLRERPDLVERYNNFAKPQTIKTDQSVEPAVKGGPLLDGHDDVGESNMKQNLASDGMCFLQSAPHGIHHNHQYGDIRTDANGHNLMTDLYSEDNVLSAVIMLTSVNHTDSTRYPYCHLCAFVE